MLGITNQKQWQECISSAMVREQWEDIETIETKVVKRCLEWLGHLARMPANRLPKQCLFGWLPKARPEKEVEGCGEGGFEGCWTE